jgi:hypothetical protein
LDPLLRIIDQICQVCQYTEIEWNKTLDRHADRVNTDSWKCSI